MEDAERTTEQAPTGTSMDRRAFFRRALLVTGGTVGVLGLAGCPSGGEDDDDDEQENEQDGEGGEGEDD